MTYGARESASASRARDIVRVHINLYHKILFSTGGNILFFYTGPPIWQLLLLLWLLLLL